jgi:hypothetical protein
VANLRAINVTPHVTQNQAVSRKARTRAYCLSVEPHCRR